MSRRQPSDLQLRSSEFPGDFPQRLDRLREASDLTWREMARQLGVSIRSLHRWRSGVRPDAAHMLVLFEFAADRKMLGCMLQRGETDRRDDRQAVLFDMDEWERLAKGIEESKLRGDAALTKTA